MFATIRNDSNMFTQIHNDSKRITKILRYSQRFVHVRPGHSPKFTRGELIFQDLYVYIFVALKIFLAYMIAFSSIDFVCKTVKK